MPPISPTELLMRGAVRSGVSRNPRHRPMTPFEQTQNLIAPGSRQLVDESESRHPEGEEEHEGNDEDDDDDDENTGDIEDFEEGAIDGDEDGDIEALDAEGAVDEGMPPMNPSQNLLFPPLDQRSQNRPRLSDHRLRPWQRLQNARVVQQTIDEMFRTFMLTDGSAIAPMEIDQPFDTTGLKEIGNLASWTVSTFKPGCGVEALRDENTNLFWQSDGPQPHHLNIHFSRLVSILSIRLYLDFEADESYTPTRITLLAGTGYHDLLPFSQLEFTQPKGWIDVDLSEVGGGREGPTAGKELRAFLVQVKIVENHQNGKDTHLRGLRVYARDERVVRSGADVDHLLGESADAHVVPSKLSGRDRAARLVQTAALVAEPDWMGDTELR